MDYQDKPQTVSSGAKYWDVSQEDDGTTRQEQVLWDHGGRHYELFTTIHRKLTKDEFSAILATLPTSGECRRPGVF